MTVERLWGVLLQCSEGRVAWGVPDGVERRLGALHVICDHDGMNNDRSCATFEHLLEQEIFIRSVEEVEVRDRTKKVNGVPVSCYT